MSGHDPDGDGQAGRARALAAHLVGKGLLTQREIDASIERQTAPHPGLGARLVARAWIDPAYRRDLLHDGKQAAADLGVDASQMTRFDVLENTPSRHHVIVCTLCSCYPRPILGEPPAWYTSAEYRGRVVREPRAVLAEFGLALPRDVEVVVVDSTADRRFMVVPLRPRGTEGMTDAQLAALVTRDSMIGVGLPLTPAA